MVARRLEDLKVWQKARASNKRIHEMTLSGTFRRDFVMVDPCRRASLSVMNNIAEGFERFRRGEFLQFLSVSKGSAGELRSMLYAALDVGHIDQATFDELFAQVDELGQSIGSFRNGLERSTPKQFVKPTRATSVSGDTGLRTKGLRTST